ncbi:MAG: O-acetylhomoserine aminocarboxypropyltransferase/cysteine synthase family protein [Candidatus Gastranaerophilaceae bacterium]
MKFDTIAVQGGHDASKNRNAISVPIYQTTAYNFDTVEYAADLFDLKCAGDIYTRISNPTTQVLEERIAALEGGVGALCVSSGQSASLLAIMNIAKAGDEIVACENIYGGTVNLLGVTLEKMGVKTNFIAGDNLEDYEKAINEKTVCIFAEALTNPNISIADIEGLAQVAHKHKLPLIIDNTVSTPYLLRPFEFGADIVVHSMTKYIASHGNSMGGAIVDSGNFDWTCSDKFKCLTDKDPSYHGLSYTETFGKAAYILKARAQLLRDIGCCISPFNSYLTLQGLETLSLRMQRHSDSALKVAEFLKNHKAIKSIYYPGLKDDKYYSLAQKYMPKGASGLLSFVVNGDRAVTTKFIENLKLPIHATNIGDTRTVVTYPALTTHRQLSAKQLEECGISESFIRLSVGLEDVDDITEDLDRALNIAVQ